MGTYIEFHQPDLSRVDDTYAFLGSLIDIDDKCSFLSLWTEEDIKHEKAKRKRGYPCFMKPGSGQLKISGDSYVEDLYRPCGVFQRLKEAVDIFGLVVELPVDADDYLEKEEIELFETMESLMARQEENRLYNQEYDRQKEIALAKEQSKLTSGLYLCKSWGNSKFWVIYGNVEKPSFYQFSFEVSGKEHRELYRDKNGYAYMLIPLMRLTGNNKGTEEVYDALVYAWDNLGLREDPNSILIACYHLLPHEVRILGDTYKPSYAERMYFSGTHDRVLAVENDEVHVGPGMSDMGYPVMLKGRGSSDIIYTDYSNLGRLYQLNLEQPEKVKQPKTWNRSNDSVPKKKKKPVEVTQVRM